MTSCLIVDDSQVMRRVVRRMLESLNLAVEEASDGSGALAACRAEPPDMVVLSGKTGTDTGLEFLRELRALADISQPAVLFCPREGEPQKVREALELGATEIITRPFDRAMLRSKLSLAAAAPEPDLEAAP